MAKTSPKQSALKQSNSPMGDMSKARKALFLACFDAANYDKQQAFSAAGIRVVKTKLGALEKTADQQGALFDLGMISLYLNQRGLDKAAQQIADVAKTALKGAKG